MNDITILIENQSETNHSITLFDVWFATKKNNYCLPEGVSIKVAEEGISYDNIMEQLQYFPLYAKIVSERNMSFQKRTKEGIKYGFIFTGYEDKHKLKEAELVLDGEIILHVDVKAKEKFKIVLSPVKEKNHPSYVKFGTDGVVPSVRPV